MKAVKIRPKNLEGVRSSIITMQHGLCQLCFEPVSRGAKKRPAMDHDHKTGYIRGVLCLYCNGKLGKVENASRLAVGKHKDNLWWLANVMEYLEKHRTPAWSLPGQRLGLIYPTHKTAEDKRLKRLENAKQKRRTAAALKRLK
jgi:hypothetical protein